MPDTRAIASLNRQTKADEDLRKWAVEVAARIADRFVLPSLDAPPTPRTDLIATARSIEDYVRGRTTT